MEDLLKHAFETSIVGLFAVVCYGLAVLACVPAARAFLRRLDPEKAFARIGFVLLPVAYIVGSISFSVGDQLFDDPDRYVHGPAAWARTLVETRLVEDGIGADDSLLVRTYRSQHDAVCAAGLPAGSEVERTRATACAAGPPLSFAAAKAIYTYQKFWLLSDEARSAEVRSVREHLRVLRGAGLTGLVVGYGTLLAALFATLAAAVLWVTGRPPLVVRSADATVATGALASPFRAPAAPGAAPSADAAAPPRAEAPPVPAPAPGLPGMPTVAPPPVVPSAATSSSGIVP